MSRAAPKGATLEETLAAAAPVPSIEATDINDGWIIDKTARIDCGNGQMKFQITLPNGDPFECSPFRIDAQREMIRVWMGAVRQAIMERGQIAAEASREAALRARQQEQLQGAGILVADAVPTAAEAKLLAGAVKGPPADPAIADRLIREMKKPPETAADMDIKQVKWELARALANVAYWRAFLESLEATGVASSDKVPTTLAEVLPRRRQT